MENTGNRNYKLRPMQVSVLENTGKIKRFLESFGKYWKHWKLLYYRWLRLVSLFSKSAASLVNDTKLRKRFHITKTLRLHWPAWEAASVCRNGFHYFPKNSEGLLKTFVAIPCMEQADLPSFDF